MISSASGANKLRPTIWLLIAFLTLSISAQPLGAQTSDETSEGGQLSQKLQDEHQERQKNESQSRHYPWFIFLAFAIALLPMSIAIGTSGSRGSSRWRNKPLGLPTGSVRAILAFTLVTFMGLYVLASVLSFTPFKPPEALLGVVSTVIGFYFASRSDDPVQNAKMVSVQGTVTKTDNNNTVPTAAAKVRLSQKSLERSITYQRTTGPDGAFQFTEVVPGAYEIEAESSDGSLKSKAQPIEVVEGSNQTISLALV